MSEPRTYEVVALPVPIAYNAHGDGDRHGTLFALARHADELRDPARHGPGTGPDPLVAPLVLRARVGERVVVELRNELGRRAGLHPQGVRYDVERADGGVVGCNPDSAADPGGRRRYVWDCEHEGVFFLGDLADLRGCECGSQAHGLFGALVVEPAGAVWTDPVTGAPADGPYADVRVPGEPAFREFVTFLQDAAPNDGGPPRALANLRCEPADRRRAAQRRLLDAGVLDPVLDPAADDGQRHSSWMHGDPATPLLRAYVGDRTRIRLVHAGLADARVFHLHGHRWHAVPGDDGSPVVDTVALAPQEALTVEPQGGAGSVHGAVGDALWEFPGTDAWGLLRVLDVAQDGSGHLPDGTPVPALRPLAGHRAPPAPTPSRPGFPGFVAGVHPQRSPRPPRTPSMPPGSGREPTDAERAAFVADAQPGEAFTRVAPPGAPVRRYRLVALQAVLRLHRGERARRRDPLGVLYALADDVEQAGGVDAFRAQVASGARTVEPVVLRASAGEVVEVWLTNALTAAPFPPVCGVHPHLVRYDPLVADGGAVGWNYLSGATAADAGPDGAGHRTTVQRWYCDGELGTVVFGAGPGPAERASHGLYGCLVVEPAGARWSDPHDPRRAATGAAAVVTLADGTAFREQVLAVADGVRQCRIPDGAAPEAVEGGVTVGYRCEPLRERAGDPADRFSSRVHGDPGTPLPRAYPGDRVRLRVYQGTTAGRHALLVHGLGGGGGGAPIAIGPYQSADVWLGPLRRPGDHLWSLAAGDDVRAGAWGLLRVHAAPCADLPPLTGAIPVVVEPRGPVRRYRVHVRAAVRDHGRGRVDPLGLVYGVGDAGGDGPLVLRARVGEWVEVTVTNELPGPPPASAADRCPPGEDDPAARTVSDRVSLHPDGLSYDVRTGDGTFVGTNPDGTVKPGDSVTYRWFADVPGPVLLSDRADVRTHRHRGLAGVLVVEPADVTPVDPSGHGDGWVGERALLRRPGRPPEHELVLLLSDGLRLFRGGDPARPVPDPSGAGQAAFNHRSAAVLPDRPSLADPHPPTPVLACAPGDRLRLHVVAATERAGDHSFTVHGHDWPADGRRAGTVGGLSAGGTRTVELVAGGPGDYAYRSGALRWALDEGLWGLIRVRRP